MNYIEIAKQAIRNVNGNGHSSFDDYQDDVLFQIEEIADEFDDENCSLEIKAKEYLIEALKTYTFA